MPSEAALILQHSTTATTRSTLPASRVVSIPFPCPIQPPGDNRDNAALSQQAQAQVQAQAQPLAQAAHDHDRMMTDPLAHTALSAPVLETAAATPFTISAFSPGSGSGAGPDSASIDIPTSSPLPLAGMFASASAPAPALALTPPSRPLSFNEVNRQKRALVEALQQLEQPLHTGRAGAGTDCEGDPASAAASRKASKRQRMSVSVSVSAAPSSSSTTTSPTPTPTPEQARKREANAKRRQLKKQAKQAAAAKANANANVTTAPADQDQDTITATKPSPSHSSGPVCRNCFHVHGPAPSSLSASIFISTKECLHCPCITYMPQVGLTQQQQRGEVVRVTRKLCSLVGRAIQEYHMIQAGDRVCVAVSGGKDSLTLIHVLKQLQRRSPVRFEVAAVTVDPQTPEYDPSKLKGYFQSLGIPYFYESQPILETARSCMDPKRVSICSFCARMKRGAIYSALRREGYNVLVMGQHLDDLAESFLMSVFYNGSLRTMKANYHVAKGDIRVIRPLIHVRERLTRLYAQVHDLPVINENCPACFEEPKERARIKLMLAQQEHIHPQLLHTIKSAMRPLMELENTAYINGINSRSNNSTSSSTPTTTTTSSSSSSNNNNNNKQHPTLAQLKDPDDEDED